MNKQIDLLEAIWIKSFNMVDPVFYDLMLVAMREKGIEHVALIMSAALLSNIDYLPKNDISLEEIKEISKDLIDGKFNSWFEDKLRINHN